MTDFTLRYLLHMTMNLIIPVQMKISLGQIKMDSLPVVVSQFQFECLVRHLDGWMYQWHHFRC